MVKDLNERKIETPGDYILFDSFVCALPLRKTRQRRRLRKSTFMFLECCRQNERINFQF